MTQSANPTPEERTPWEWAQHVSAIYYNGPDSLEVLVTGAITGAVRAAEVAARAPLLALLTELRALFDLTPSESVMYRWVGRGDYGLRGLLRRVDTALAAQPPPSDPASGALSGDRAAQAPETK